MSANEQAERIEALSQYVAKNEALFRSGSNKEVFAKLLSFGVWNGLTSRESRLLDMKKADARRLLEEQVEKATVSEVAFIFSKRMAAYHIMEKVQMPDCLAEFTSSLLLGGLSAPLPSPASEGHMIMRDGGIWELVNKARLLGAPTQEVAYQEVSDVLLKFGLRANNPSTIKKKYLSFRRMMTDEIEARSKVDKQ